MAGEQRRVFTASPEQVRVARGWVADLLGSDHPAADDCVLLVSETFTNAVLHGGGARVEVCVQVGERAVRVEVIDDGGRGLPHYVDDPRGEGGRGLPILRALAKEWGFEVLLDERLRVWFRIEAE
ncbi:ATP-binding protein [Actinomadura hibisca]|uniref:ATP-binding protein n=1 Tax=Actinomadura hibisca TaxID=68565 RepID=UPI00082CC3EC|nr:ATP-binding protein [Actinomadura hibisca]